MPFPDEIGPVAIVDHRPQWPLEFEESAGQLRAAMGGVPLHIDHVGFTSVPGLAAKDCVDVQIRVRSIDEARDIALLSAIGFRCRPEPWNRTEVSGAIPCRNFAYGRIKAPATEVLMAAAERWATETAWSVTPRTPPASA
ncbi:GrpB family protein [Streptomyces sp. NPDC055092]